MYHYTFSNKDTEDLTEKTKNYSNMIESFEEIDKKFSSEDSGSLNLEQKTFEKPTNEEIKKQAEDSLHDYKQTNLQNIEEQYKTKQDNIEEQIKDTYDSSISKKEETKNLYSSLKQDAANDALKRGLARSSIVINVLDAFDKNMIAEYNKINEQISTKIDNLNSQKQLLDEQRQNALNSFDISYAVKLSTKIDEINQALQKEEQKVLEYNNEIAQKEAEYEAKRKQNALDYAQYIQKNGTETITKIKQDEKYSIAKNYLMTLSKSQALEELENNRVFSSQLGPTNYSKLKVLMLGREE